ncbi:MAG: hypothetical protein JWN04_6559 [Myxococcaceae bacterium]|nr:hypothetical protein [Myxococcaceae bacterium]
MERRVTSRQNPAEDVSDRLFRKQCKPHTVAPPTCLRAFTGRKGEGGGSQIYERAVRSWGK